MLLDLIDVDVYPVAQIGKIFKGVGKYPRNFLNYNVYYIIIIFMRL